MTVITSPYEETHNCAVQKGKGEVLSCSAQFVSCKYKKPGRKKNLNENQRAPARLQVAVHHTDTFCQGRWKEKPNSKPKFASYTSP